MTFILGCCTDNEEALEVEVAVGKFNNLHNNVRGAEGVSPLFIYKIHTSTHNKCRQIGGEWGG